MSKRRMIDIKTSLQDVGLKVLSASPDKDLFAVVDDSVNWLVVGREADLETNPPQVEIQFNLFDDMGRRTCDLRDILYAITTNRTQKLYFDKRESKEWQQELHEFVSQIKNELDQCK